MITEPEVRAALTYMQNLREQFPDFAYDDKPPQALLDRIDAYNMMIMREILEAADTAREHVIQETP